MPRPAPADSRRPLPKGLVSLLAGLRSAAPPGRRTAPVYKVAVGLQKAAILGGVEAASPERTHDGRNARAERSRAAVVEALLELLDAGDVRPTAERIAARAGVSERTVFQHFRDREALFEAAARRQYERVVPTLRPVSRELPLERRIA